MAGAVRVAVAGDRGGSMRHDVILIQPSFGVPSRRPRQTPEERIRIAVLHDALECLERLRFAVSRRERRLFEATRRWFLSDDSEWPYSFERICAALDLDASTVRRRLAARAVARRASRVPAPSRMQTPLATDVAPQPDERTSRQEKAKEAVQNDLRVAK